LGLLLLYIIIGLFTVIGIFTPNDELAKEVVEASQRAGEKLWRLPLEESYWESMKSGVADMVNTGGRQGGSITAALFLKQVNFFLSLYVGSATVDVVP
jgi:leucyl aminopeptidase